VREFPPTSPPTGALRGFLFLIGCGITLAWVAITVAVFWNVVASGCIVRSRPICGDVRRGAFFVSVFLGILALPVGSLLMLPGFLRFFRPKAG
jgi:hypothetical protein